MERSDYLRLMSFPSEWVAWNMTPAEWLTGAIASYQPGMENASEHDRHGAFQWWLKNEPTVAQLVKLGQLSNLDPDQLMAKSVRDQIRVSAKFCKEVEAALSESAN